MPRIRELVGLYHFIRANLVVIEGVEGIGTVLDGHSCNSAAAIRRDGYATLPLTQNVTIETNAKVSRFAKRFTIYIGSSRLS